MKWLDPKFVAIAVAVLLIGGFGSWWWINKGQDAAEDVLAGSKCISGSPMGILRGAIAEGGSGQTQDMRATWGAIRDEANNNCNPAVGWCATLVQHKIQIDQIAGLLKQNAPDEVKKWLQDIEEFERKNPDVADASIMAVASYCGGWLEGSGVLDAAGISRHKAECQVIPERLRDRRSPPCPKESSDDPTESNDDGRVSQYPTE